MKDIKYIILYLVPVPEPVNNYGYGSAKVLNKITVPVPIRQKVTVPTDPVPQPGP